MINLFAHNIASNLLLPSEKAFSEESTIPDSEALQIGHMKGIFTKMHKK